MKLRHFDLLAQPPGRVFIVYLVALLALAVYCLVRTPILAVDNDLWYHLSHGRHLFTTGEIPDTSYFSFISPARTWVDYYWLFQALVYSIYAVAGHFGLLLLRGALFAGFFTGVAAFLARGAATWRQWVWVSLIAGFYLTPSFHKYEMVRPHALTYLFIPIFLYVLEFKPERAWLLPILAVLWTNFHGVEYPVMVLIVFSYVLEIWRRRLREKRELERREVLLQVWLGLCLAAVFLTLHGFRLVEVPFVSTEYASVYLDELSQVDPKQFLSYSLNLGGWTQGAAFNVLLFIAVLCGLGNAARGELRLSHLLMLLGGLFLVSKAVRLSHESSLLVLPLLQTHGPLWRSARRRSSLAVPIAASMLALALPLAFLKDRLPHRDQSYPLALDNLPHGVASFLNRVEAEGAVMNNPNVGGYLQWALDARYKIFMDLEIPFLFADEDMYEVASAFFDPESLRRFLERYRPPFLAATLAADRFPALIAAHPRYRPVFFDDQGVLYVDRRRYPEIVERHALEWIDPFTIGQQRFSTLSGPDRRSYLAELLRMSAIDPDVSSVNQSAAILLNLEGRHDEAIEHARRVIVRNPAHAQGHAILGDALSGKGDFEEAIATYRRALRHSRNETERRFIAQSLSAAYRQAGRPREAYEALQRGVGIFNVEASYRELYELGVLAAAAGEPQEALKMFSFALFKVPSGEAELRRQIEEHVATLEATGPE